MNAKEIVADGMNGGWNGKPATYCLVEYPEPSDEYPNPLFHPDPRRFHVLAPPLILAAVVFDLMISRDGKSARVAA
jgi:hypothetical protein